MDFPHNLGGTYMSLHHFVLYRLHLIHMEMVYKELAFLPPQELKTKLSLKRRNECRNTGLATYNKIIVTHTHTHTHTVSKSELCMTLSITFLHCCTKHCVNGSPVNPFGQTQFGVWLTTWHCALVPHDPGHGSWHLRLMHAKWLAHSLLLTHCGRQLGGEPMKSGRQEHDGPSSDTLHAAFGPHGDGWHGFFGSACGGFSAVKTCNASQ